MRIKTAEQPEQTVTPAAPAVVWPTDESRQTVVQTNQSAWQRHAESARDHRECAKRLDFEIGTKSRELDTKSRELEQLRQDIEMRIQEMPKQDHYALQEQAAADAYAVALTALGEQLPPLPERPASGGMSALEAQAHAAAWSGMDPAPTGVQPYPPAAPQESAQTSAWSFPDTKQDGYCIHCGQPAWRVPVSEVNPKGARHSFGATCNPDNPDSKQAELSDLPGSDGNQ